MPARNRELRDIGRFIRAHRELSNATMFPQIPRRRRHVPYLTQCELADLLGVSTVVVSQIEQARYPNLTTTLLHRIADVLMLTNQQVAYLLGLLEPRPPHQKSFEPAPEWVITSVKNTDHPVILVNPAYDLITANARADTLFNRFELGPHAHTNIATWLFHMPAMQEAGEKWQLFGGRMVSRLKMNYAMRPEFRDYLDEVAERIENVNTLFGNLWNQADPLVQPVVERALGAGLPGPINILLVVNEIAEEPTLTRVEFIPADDDARETFSRI